MKPIIISLFFSTLLFFCFNSLSQSLSDYRSATSGDWTSPSSWEYYDGANWVAAVNVPNHNDGMITIRNNHVISLFVNKTIDQFQVDFGGELIFGGLSNVNLTVNNGAGVDFLILGTFTYNSGNINGNQLITIGNTGILNIASESNHFLYTSIENNGIINWLEAGIYLFAGNSIINNGSFNIFTNLNYLHVRYFYGSGGLTSFINNGIINKTSSVGIGFTNFDFTNYGIININSGGIGNNTANFMNFGTINLTGGTFSNNGYFGGKMYYKAGSIITGSGFFYNNSQLQLDADCVLPLNVNLINRSGAIINGEGNLIINGNFSNECSGYCGYISGTGSLKFNGVSNIEGGSISRNVIENNGTLNINSNINVGVFNISSIFTNNGTINKNFNGDLFIATNELKNNGVLNLNLLGNLILNGTVSPYNSILNLGEFSVINLNYNSIIYKFQSSF